MSQLSNTLKTYIKILSHPLKEEEALDMVLRRKLTKKEYKLLKGWSEKAPIESLRLKLNYDEHGYTLSSQKLIKKLNQEKFKKEIYL